VTAVDRTPAHQTKKTSLPGTKKKPPELLGSQSPGCDPPAALSLFSLLSPHSFLHSLLSFLLPLPLFFYFFSPLSLPFSLPFPSSFLPSLPPLFLLLFLLPSLPLSLSPSFSGDSGESAHCRFGILNLPAARFLQTERLTKQP
jgi:hypothetical protein